MGGYQFILNYPAYGQDFSTVSNAVSIYPGPSTAKFIISFQNEPAPTSGGIKSDASNLNEFALNAAAIVSPRILFIGDAYNDVSKPVWALHLALPSMIATLL